MYGLPRGQIGLTKFGFGSHRAEGAGVPGKLCNFQPCFAGSVLLHGCVAVRAWTLLTARLALFFGMGPEELDVFFKRMFALKVPKDLWT